MTVSATTKIATFAGGCFWCMEPPFIALKGVLSTEVGYMGGSYPNPTYEDICTGTTGHAEVIHIHYDDTLVSYNTLVDTFWKNIDPTTLNQQFSDRGTQYRTAIFYYSNEQKDIAEHSKHLLETSNQFKTPIVTEITPASTFYPAEDYHQEYFKKQPVRYQWYKTGSGREQKLKKIWAD